jgi:hypothetical protein
MFDQRINHNPTGARSPARLPTANEQGAANCCLNKRGTGKDDDFVKLTFVCNKMPELGCILGREHLARQNKGKDASRFQPSKRELGKRDVRVGMPIKSSEPRAKSKAVGGPQRITPWGIVDYAIERRQSPIRRECQGVGGQKIRRPYVADTVPAA